MKNTFSEIKDEQKTQKNGSEDNLHTIKKIKYLLNVCAVSLV